MQNGIEISIAEKPPINEPDEIVVRRIKDGVPVKTDVLAFKQRFHLEVRDGHIMALAPVKLR